MLSQSKVAAIEGVKTEELPGTDQMKDANDYWWLQKTNAEYLEMSKDRHR